jgi:pimeloyl-ACP methyl ester carboxylesterase
MRKLKLFFLILIGSVIVISLSGFAYQLIMEESDNVDYPAPGKIYQIDGLGLHLDCRGEGSPTVIMEAGLTSGSLSWLLVHDEIAAVTRTCAYDRPGMDWSEPINRLADAEEVGERLYKLLAEANIYGPKVLLGMSAGGVYVREYYKNHSENIVGMVFVDSSHEQQENRLPKLEGSGNFKTILNACRLLQPIGFIRAFGLLDQFVDQFGLSETARNAFLAKINQSHSCSSMYWENESFAGEVQDEAPPTSLGDLPLVVLSQGEEPKAVPEIGMTLVQAIAQRKVWNALQQELVGLSSNGKRCVASESGHVIQFSQPELVIEKVSELVLHLRASLP